MSLVSPAKNGSSRFPGNARVEQYGPASAGLNPRQAPPLPPAEAGGKHRSAEADHPAPAANPRNSTRNLEKPLRLAVLLSGGGRTLANLIQRITDDRLRRVEIGLVISSRRTVRGVAIAREAGLAVEIIRPGDFADEPAFSDAVTAAIERAAVDLVVMAGFLCHWQLPPRWLGRALNIHPALLPRFGGKGMFGEHVHAAVLAAGERESGCTVHLVDDLYDHGPIVAQRRVPVLPADTPETLAARVFATELELYPEVIQLVADRGLTWLRELSAQWATSRGAKG
jgi:phosphoribosylglycinamide formyltransferase-1